MTRSATPRRRAALMSTPFARGVSLRTDEHEGANEAIDSANSHRYPRHVSRGRGDNGNTPPLHGGVGGSIPPASISAAGCLHPPPDAIWEESAWQRRRLPTDR